MPYNKSIFDPRLPAGEIMKALDVSGGDAMIQEEIDKIIADLIEIRNPLRQNLPRRAGSGDAWIVVRRTDRGAGTFVSDTDTGTESEGTYAQVTFPYKTPLFEGKVTRKLQAVGRSFGDLLMEEIENGMQVIRDLEEDKLINGDAAGTPKEFSGLKTFLDAEAAQTLDLSNMPLTVDAMDEAIDKLEGDANMIVTSKRTARELNGLLQQNQRFLDTVEVEGGFKLSSYNSIPIFTSNFVSILEGGGDESRVYFVDTSEVFVGELTPLTFLALAKDSSQYDRFHIFEDMSLVFKNPKKASQIKGVAPPP